MTDDERCDEQKYTWNYWFFFLSNILCCEWFEGKNEIKYALAIQYINENLDEIYNLPRPEWSITIHFVIHFFFLCLGFWLVRFE